MLERLKEEAAIVPALCHLEILNVLLIAERKHPITRAQAERLSAYLAELPLITETEFPPARLPATLDLGRSLNVTVYDAANIELALRLGLPLASLDRHMHRAAKALGIPLLIEH